MRSRLTTRTGLLTGSMWIASSAFAWGLCMEPSIRSTVAWDVTDAPFEVAEFLGGPPAETNAAPLYLDAFYEFSSVVEVCFSAAQRESRTPIARGRERRSMAFMTGLNEMTEHADVAGVDKILAEHDDGFKKLRLAQQRKDCVFENKLGRDRNDAHTYAARQAARVLGLKVRREVEQGQLDTAIGSIEMALRLSRDLRPRGSGTSQRASIEIDSLVFSNLVKRVLAAPDLTAEQCKRMLAIIDTHAREGVDMFLAALRTAYVDGRTLLHRLSNGAQQENIILRKETVPKKKDDADTTDKFDVVTPGIQQKERRALNRAYSDILNHRRPAFDMESDRLQNFLSDLNKSTTVTKFVLAEVPALYESVVDHDTLQNATICLVAIRLWQLSRSEQIPDDLFTIVDAAGLKVVPVDRYSGKTMNLTFIGGKPVVYSVGKNGRDDKGTPARDFEGNTGDILFQFSG